MGELRFALSIRETIARSLPLREVLFTRAKENYMFPAPDLRAVLNAKVSSLKCLSELYVDRLAKADIMTIEQLIDEWDDAVPEVLGTYHRRTKQLIEFELKKYGFEIRPYTTYSLQALK